LWVIDRQNPARSGAAHDLSEWLMDPARLARFAAATGYVPPRASAVDEPVLVQAWADRPQLRVAYDQLAGLAGDPAQIGLQVGPRQEIQRVLEIAASLTVTGEVDPADELRKAETLATGLMEEYRRSLGP
jgi:ABC-type glycerol-3-phosphate transport system substrate-binding protein